MDAHTIFILKSIAIPFCLSQSAMFSGLNLAFFSIGRLRLETEVENGNKAAAKILALRKDANFLLSTILWGNVGANVILAMLMDSVIPGSGLLAFVISTVGITFLGEILPQAYFSRNAIRIGSKLAPVIRFYQFILFPVAKPSAFILDGWVGTEGVNFMREKDIEVILQKHIKEQDSEIGETEGQGALNFLDLDDRLISKEGMSIDPATIHSFTSNMDLPEIPKAGTTEGDTFIEMLRKSDKSRAIITDEEGEPRVVLKTSDYLFKIASSDEISDIYDYCHRPIVVKDASATLDTVLGEFVVEADDREDYIIDRDVIIYWNGSDKRIITGADILGRLLKGIAKREKEQS